MPEFNVGDEVIFVGGSGYVDPAEIAGMYSPNGRSFTIAKIVSQVIWVDTTRHHQICAPFKVWCHASPPETVRAMSNKVYREYIKCM